MGTLYQAKMDTLWKSSLNRQIKIRLFIVTIDPILLYESENWTLSARQHRRLDGCYTRLLRRVLNLSWKSHPTLTEIYGDLPRISKRRVQFAGHWLCTCLWRTYFIFYSLEAPIITWAVSETYLSKRHKQGHSHPQGRPYGSNDRQGVLERWSKFNLGRNRKMMMWWKLDSEKSLNSKNTLANSLGYFLYSVWLWPNLKCFNVRHCPI